MKQSTLKSFIIKPAAAAVPRNEIQCDQITAKPDNRQPRPSAKRKAPHNDPNTRDVVVSCLIGSTSMPGFGLTK